MPMELPQTSEKAHFAHFACKILLRARPVERRVISRKKHIEINKGISSFLFETTIQTVNTWIIPIRSISLSENDH